VAKARDDSDSEPDNDTIIEPELQNFATLVFRFGTSPTAATPHISLK